MKATTKTTRRHTSATLVVSTRKLDQNFIRHLRITSGLHNLEIIPIENDHQYSLSQAYNMGLEQAKNDIIIFCHDDVRFDSLNWGLKFVKHFDADPEYGIIGVAGTNHLIDGCWWSVRGAMHGIVNHSEHGKRWITKFSEDQGKKLKRMIVVDGVCFAIDKTKIIHKFDEEFKGFHFYDLAFGFANFLADVKIGVCTDIRLTHMSVGRTNDEWEANKKQFEEKYKLQLPRQLSDEFSEIKRV